MLRFYEVVTAALEKSKGTGGKPQQAVLANKLGCWQTAVSGYLRGANLPPTSRLQRYAPVLGMPVEVLATIVATDRAMPRAKLMRLATDFHRKRASKSMPIAS